MRVLVTGGAGFIGSHIADALLDRGDTPTVLDNLSSGDLGNVPEGVDVIEQDVASSDIAKTIAALRPDAVIHAAAQASVAQSMADPTLDRMVNLVGTSNVIEGARRAGTQRIVFLSTGGGIYGETISPATEASLPRPKSFYSVHKYAAEQYCQLSGLSFGIARLANVYGMRQQAGLEGGVVAVFAERLRKGEPITIYGTGDQRRDLVHVRDVAEAILRILDSAQNDTWNVGTGNETTINELLALMDVQIARARTVHREATRAGDVFRSCLSPAKIGRDLGWRPTTMLAQGIAELV